MKTKMIFLLFEDYFVPKNFIAEVIPMKIAFKLMNGQDNLYENFVNGFYVKFGKL
jgi:hypothetical protein